MSRWATGAIIGGMNRPATLLAVLLSLTAACAPPATTDDEHDGGAAAADAGIVEDEPDAVLGACWTQCGTNETIFAWWGPCLDDPQLGNCRIDVDGEGRLGTVRTCEECRDDPWHVRTGGPEFTCAAQATEATPTFYGPC